MGAPTLPLNGQTGVAAPLNLSDLLQLFKLDVMRSINCIGLATVQSFSVDSATGRAVVSATLNYDVAVTSQNSAGQFYTRLIAHPPAFNCPYLVIGGGGAGLQAPAQPGDQCLLLFNDVDIQNWWAGARGGAPASAASHSFSNALAVVGFNAWPLSSDTSHLMLTNGNAQVGVKLTAGDALVRIANATTTLNTLLGNLISTINAITTSNAVPGSPCTISPASQSALSSIATQLGQLLE